jgi:RNA 2',3'-cyclic 3'-phosphodiesterase
MRLFIGIMLPEEVQQQVIKIQKEISITSPGGLRWVKPEKLHITLSFLGEVDPSVVSEIIKQQDQIVSVTQPFLVGLKDISYYPGCKNARVITLGIIRGDEEIRSLGEQFSKLLEGKFISPHVTICRMNKPIDLEKFNKEVVVKSIKTKEDIVFNVESVCLVESRQKRGGSEYKTIYESKIADRLSD